MPRLRRSDPSRPGYLRRRRGRGFSYLDEGGRRIVDAAVLRRIGELVLPPAWENVWISPDPNGHIQAIGTDAAGRRQYRYHDHWRLRRDAAKHDRMLSFAEALPAARRTVCDHLGDSGLSRRRVLGCAVRLLDLGFFRMGGEEYETYGLATIHRHHVKIEKGVIQFEYPAKGGLTREQPVADEGVRRVVRSLKGRRGGGSELLAWRDRAGWHDLRSADINDYVRVVTGGDYTAKDFRTWNATVFAAVGLAAATPAAESKTAAKRAVALVVRDVARYLGNTPAVARRSYIDPRAIELYQDGVTIVENLGALGECSEPGTLATHGGIETAVLELLRGERGRARAGVALAVRARPQRGR